MSSTASTEPPRSGISKPFAIGFGIMAVLIAAALWIGFSKTSGNYLQPTGSIGKVRTLKITDNLTFMVIDFNIKNDSGRDMVVHSIEASIDDASGKNIEGSLVAASDTRDAFHNYPVLGEEYNPPMRERDTIPAHQSVDRMVGVRLDAPNDAVEGRKRVTLRVTDVTGPMVEMTK